MRRKALAARRSQAKAAMHQRQLRSPQLQLAQLGTLQRRAATRPIPGEQAAQASGEGVIVARSIRSCVSRGQCSQQVIAPRPRAVEEHQPRRLQVRDTGMRSSSCCCSARLCRKWAWTKAAWPTGVPRTTRPRRSGGSVQAQPHSRRASCRGAPLCPHAPAKPLGQRWQPRVPVLADTQRRRHRGKRKRSFRGAMWEPRRLSASSGAIRDRAGPATSNSGGPTPVDSAAGRQGTRIWAARGSGAGRRFGSPEPMA